MFQFNLLKLRELTGMIQKNTCQEEEQVTNKGQNSSRETEEKKKETADYEEEKDELRMWLVVVPDEEEFVDPEILHTKLVMERFQDNTPEGYNLMLWGDLKILVDPEQDDDIWKNQNQWKIISWKLYETCGYSTWLNTCFQQLNLFHNTNQSGGWNIYAVLQSIPCSPECKIRTVSKVPDTEDTIKFMLDTQQFTYTVDMFRDTLHLPVETYENLVVTPANIHTIKAFMNRVGYQGVVNKLFHVVLNQTHVDYAALLWWDFMNNVFYKKESIQYPRFIKLIINDLMKKFPNIRKRLEEDYHSIKDDVPLVSVYTTGNVLVQGMLILDALLTTEIRETDDFKEYETVFMKVAVLMNQPQPVVSTQGTNMNTPRAHRTTTISASPHETKKRKQTAGESSSRRITIKRKKQSTPSIPPPGDDRERDAIAEATLLSLTLHKTALLAEAQENIAKFQEKLDEEEIHKPVDGDDDDESSASAFADSVLNDDGDDTGSKLKPGRHKEHPEHVSDDDEMKNKDEENEDVVTEKEVVDMSGSQEIRKEHTQTPIPSPIRSPRNDLSSDKTISEELADTVTPTTATSSKTPSTTTRQKKSFTAKTRRLSGSIAGICRRRGLIRSHIKTKFINREFFMEKIKEVIQHCDKIVLELTVTKTNEMLKKEMPRLVKLAVNKDRKVSPVDISGMVSKEFVAYGPKLIEELFQKHMQNTTLNLYPKTKSSTATTSSADLQQQLYLSMKTKPQDQAADPEI
ncbi:hypothetical protein Tco_1319714 [Tanacetum coccineum]